ncbi:MAG: sialidase family protein [Candidatus Poribacteria bacterium]|nr:sialidase family protein [Candidatus Poribacteria bacterium]MDE0506484.1 sialidase family protein [Candidatus Poribacteria bacterium]
MIWTRRLMRTAFIFFVTMTAPTYESNADIRTDWIRIYDTEAMRRVTELETDGRRLYAGTKEGLHISDDDGYTWRLTLDVEHCIAITSHQNTVYAGTYYDGVFRSENHGVTWKPINNGFRKFDWREGESSYGNIKQILAIGDGTVITTVRPHTYTSADRGETWQDVSEEWKVRQWEAPDWIFGRDIDLMAEFDGYLWVAAWSQILRSPDNGKTWEYAGTRNEGFVWATDWAVLNNRLYIAAEKHYSSRNRSDKGFFARYGGALHWEVLNQGLPPHDVETTEFYGVPMVLRTHLTNIESLAVNRGRLFAGLNRRGVYMFDERSERWIPAGLDGLTVTSIVSHQSNLYAATGEGIYRASIPVVQPHGKAAATWGAVKRQ